MEVIIRDDSVINNQFADFKNDTYCISQLVHALWKSLVNQNFV